MSHTSAQLNINYDDASKIDEKDLQMILNDVHLSIGRREYNDFIGNMFFF